MMCIIFNANQWKLHTIRSTTQHGAHPSHKVCGRQPVLTQIYGQIIRGHLYMDSLIEYNGEDCHIHQQIVTRLVIKEIVTTIGDNAFEDNEVLKELKLCDSLRQIGNYSFKGFVSLEKLK